MRNLKILSIALISVFFQSCSKTDSHGENTNNSLNDTNLSKLPVLNTFSVSSNVVPNAKSGGEISSDGGSAIVDRGIVWGEKPQPTVSKINTTHDGSGIGSFISKITETEIGKTYFVRAYATNANGTAYGNQVVFTAQTGYNIDLAMMTATINNLQYDFMRPYLFGTLHHNDITMYNQTTKGTIYIGLQGTSTDDLNNVTTRRQIDIYIPNNKWSAGTYELVEEVDRQSTTVGACQAKLLLPNSSTKITAGTLTITEFNRIERKIVGKFEFDYKLDNSPTTYQVRNGTFSYSLDHSYFN